MFKQGVPVMRMRDDDGHQAMIQCGKAWNRVKKSQHRLWSDWTMEIGPALMKARAEAMSVAETNRPGDGGHALTSASTFQGDQ
jgi:hypothetical protein